MSASTHKASDGRIDAQRLDAAGGRKALTIGAALAVVGIALGAAGYFSDADRFAFSYLTGFAYVATIAAGGLIFTIIQHIVRAGWSVAVRRQLEWIAGFLPIVALLFIPIALMSHTLYHEWMGPEAAHDPVLSKKLAYLNPGFFFGRAAVYLVVFSGLSFFFRSNSLKQDESGDVGLTHTMQKWAPPSAFAFALSLSFAGFDWLMSLYPHWYSTIFGIYIFAGSATSSLSLLALLTIGLQASGLIKKVSTVEHRHDIGKLLFGFTVFWAYIAFSQFFLIWYANLPEETVWYRIRWLGEGWKGVSLLLLFGHFWFPFFLLISRTAKRSVALLGLGAVWHLVMHYVDMYWLVMPNYVGGHGGHGPTPETAHFMPSWIDAAGLLLPVGLFAAWIGYRLSKDNLYPVKDPRLAESMTLENL